MSAVTSLILMMLCSVGKDKTGSVPTGGKAHTQKKKRKKMGTFLNEKKIPNAGGGGIRGFSVAAEAVERGDHVV